MDGAHMDGAHMDGAHMTGTVFRRELPGSPASARAARLFVDEVLTGADRDQLSYLAGLLVSELVTNAVLHTGTEVEVAVLLAGDVVRVEVHDGSPLLPSRKHYSNMSGTGRGLIMVTEMASRWGAEATATGKMVWFELDPEASPQLDLLGIEAL
jgi:anti-sigma regulatory factor (Ser/Thr protein kinase)